jgi:CheY-like chemotaxis protein
MQNQSTAISDGLLLIEGDFADATQVLNALTGRGQPHVEGAHSLSEGLQRLKRPGIAAIFLNLFLPDSTGIETFDKTQAAAGHIPILVLCSTNNEHIGRLAVEHGADAETVLMKHPESTVSLLESLKGLGVQLTVDDFGTGYASLSYLSQFPIDSLKVDQSFVREISTTADDARTVSAVIRMGNSLRKRVIAEGVETREQLEFLAAEGCSQGQGFYFHRPMVADQFAALLAAGA